MGTRADFYIGRGETSEWIGSIAWDGYPSGNPRHIIKCSTEVDFRKKVAALLNREGGTTPEMGWPWPWNDSNTTDYAYAFDGNGVYGTCFGGGWWPADQEPEDSCSDEEGKCIFPQMDTRKQAPAGSDRSGVMVITRKVTP